MENDPDYESLYQQVIEENERLRLHILDIKVNGDKFSFDRIFDALFKNKEETIFLLFLTYILFSIALTVIDVIKRVSE